MDAHCRLVDVVGCICNIGRSVPDGALGPLKHGMALIAIASGFRLDVELARDFMEYLACVLVKWGEGETGHRQTDAAVLGADCHSPSSRAEEERG